MHLENRIRTRCRGKHSPDRKRKAVGQERHDSAKSRRAINPAPNRNDIQHISIGHDSGGVIMILLKNSSPEGGIFCFRLKTMSVTAYMMLVLPREIRLEEICCEILGILNPKLDTKFFVFERWNYCAGTAMFLHTILSLKQILITYRNKEKRNV